MAEKTEFLQAIDDAILDADSLEKFINGSDSETVLTRLSAEYPTLQKALKELFENGGIAGRFKTLAELQTSDLVEGDYALVADDADDKNGIYIKEGEAWVKSKYGIQEAVAKALSTALDYTDSKLLDVLDYSINLVDPSKATSGVTITSDGTIVDAAAYRTSDFIPVAPGAEYTMYRNSKTTPDVRAYLTIVYYDASKEFISRLSPISQGTEIGPVYTKLVIPANTYYIRLSSNAGAIDQYDRMFYAGSEQVAYEPYEKPTLNKDILKDILKLIEDSSSSALIREVIHPSTNLVNPETAQSGYVIQADGNIKTEGVTQYATSDYIEVVAGETYTGYRNSITTPNVYPYFFVAYYDTNKKFIRRENFPREGVENLGELYISYVIPEGVSYIRLMTNAGKIDQYKRMFYKGGEEIPYQGYSLPTLDNVILSDFVKGQVQGSTTPSGDLGLSKSYNLFNYEDVTTGKAITSEGEIIDSEQIYWLSGYVAVEPSTPYTISGAYGLDAMIATAFFDKDKKFISRILSQTRTFPYGRRVITTPSNAFFVRFNINQGTPSANQRMFHKGTESLKYLPYGIETLNDITLDESTLVKSGVVGNGLLNHSYMLDTIVTETYSITKDLEGNRADHYRQPHTNVHTKFDSLVALDGDYVTKEVLGEDDYGNEIPCYHFKPQLPDSNMVRRIPKIFITCGTHGYEHVPPLAVYLTMKEVITNWESDPALELLRHNVHLIVIPVVNPSGWDDYTRTNRNGIDINRSFPPDFGWQSTDPDSPYYGGEEPLQEKESQYIKRIFDEHPDIVACYDFHNFHGSSTETRYIWIPTGVEAVQRMTQTLIAKLTRKWRNDFEWFPESPYFAGNTSYSSGAMVQAYALSRGVPLTATIEVCEKWWVSTGTTTYDGTHCKTAVEFFTNWLVINLQHIEGKRLI